MVSKLPASEFTFVHAADLHLDTPFKGIGQTAPYVAHQLREASLDAFDRLIELCLSVDAAFLLVAGDVYDGPERGLRAQLRFRDGLRRLSDEGIHSFVVHGNHDPVETGWSALSGPWPELVTVFGPGEVGAVTVERAGHPLATVQGISYATRSEPENLATRFSPHAGPGLQVGVLHCNVKGAASGYDDYSPCTLAELRSIGLDYWALGHIHSRLVLSGVPGGTEPYVVYPGNLQARSPKPSERGPKGATVVRVAGGSIAEVEAVACDQVRFSSVEVDVAGALDIADLKDTLLEASGRNLADSDGRSLVLRGTLVGRGPVSETLRHRGSVDELLSSLRDGFREELPFAWWDGLADETGGPGALDQDSSGSDFTADLVRIAAELRDDVSTSGFLPADLLDDVLEGLPSHLKRHDRLVRALEAAALTPVGLMDRAAEIALAELRGDDR